MRDYSYQLAWHDDRHTWPDWGSAARGNLVDLDFAHRGEWLDSVIGKDPCTGKDRIYHILKCENCVTIHAWPLPHLDDLEAYYRREFYQQEKPDYLERYEGDKHWWKECVHSPLLHQAMAACAQQDWPRMQVLEAGAGPGLALDVAAEEGWGTYAVEPSPVCAEHLRKHGHVVYEGSLERYAATVRDHTRQFDIVYLYEVLEHQPSPSDFLHECLHLTKPGGVLVVCVPNDASPIQYQVCKHLGLKEPYWWAPPQHLHYFSPKFLQLMVRWAGYDVLDIRGSAALELAILNGQNYLGNDTVGRAVHTARMKKELAAVQHGIWGEVEAQYRVNMAEARLGREIYCLAQKPLEPVL
ncbi:MAG TPA: class I SAM-dependent methyltransferase [Candidatus Tectomicrobia bacterium]